MLKGQKGFTLTRFEKPVCLTIIRRSIRFKGHIFTRPKKLLEESSEHKLFSHTAAGLDGTQRERYNLMAYERLQASHDMSTLR